MKLPETVEEYIDQFMVAVKPLRDRARTDILLRRALLVDPIAVLKRENIALVPGLRYRFFEHNPRKDELAIPLLPYEGEA